MYYFFVDIGNVSMYRNKMLVIQEKDMTYMTVYWWCTDKDKARGGLP